MKKATALLCIILIILSLAGCSGGKPDETSDAMYQIGLNALQTADDYINGKLTSEEAETKLKDFKEQADRQYESDLKHYGTGSLVGTDINNDYFIQSAIFYLCFNADGSMDKFIESRNELAERIGK